MKICQQAEVDEKRKWGSIEKNGKNVFKLAIEHAKCEAVGA